MAMPPEAVTPYQPSKERFDRVTETQTNFDAFHIETSTIETLLLLLGCDEEEIQVQALDHLDRYGLKTYENYILLYDKGIVDQLMANRMYDSNFLYVQRFTFKIIAQLIKIVEDGGSIKQKLMKMDDLYALVVDKLITRNDHFLVEYFTLILNQYCDEPRHCDELIRNDEFLDKCYRLLAKTRDSDIFVNLTQIFEKLTRNPYGMLKISSQPYVPFQVLMSALKSKYSLIQSSALELLKNIVQSDGFLKYLNTTFLDEIFKILENFLWIDLHVAAINVLRNAVQHEEVAKHVYQNSYLARLFVYYDKVEENRLKVFGVFNSLARYQNAREALYQNDLVPHLLEVLGQHPNTDVIQCIGLMVEHYASREEIIDSNVIAQLLHIMSDPTKDWDIRTSATHTLVILLRLNKKMCTDLVANDGTMRIAVFFEPSAIAMETDIHCNLITAMDILSRFDDIREALMVEPLATNLAKSIEKLASTPALTQLLCDLADCISLFITEEVMQNALIKQNLSQWLIRCLKNCQIKVQSTANDFIILTAKYELFCNEYVYGDVLKVLLAGKEAVSECPNWSSAIDTILSNDIKVKFSVKGYLDYNDLIANGFYCSKKRFDKFTTLVEIMNSEVSPLHPIYMVNFDRTTLDRDECIKKLLHGDSGESLEYDRCPVDVFLPRYLEKLREKFDEYGLRPLEQSTDYFDMSDIEKRIEIIADMVVTELTPSPLQTTLDDSCFDHAFEMHLRELKMALHCNIIPFGQLNMGGLFEKALLFKVLADQVGVPCTLRLGIDNITAWNEISLYKPERNSRLSLIPRDYLQSTHLVDLRNSPGRLYPINGVMAWEYRKLNCGEI